jgi:hypothetical protein
MKLDFETKAGTRKEYILKKPGQDTESIVQLTSLEVANLKNFTEKTHLGKTTPQVLQVHKTISK